MHYKSYPIQIFFLDENLQKSAEALSDKRLSMTMYGCFHALMAARFYYSGIRSTRFYNYYFNPERLSETLDKWFTGWPLVKLPTFKRYDSRESKWTRQCKEHYDYVKEYLRLLVYEHSYRTNSTNEMLDYLDWEDMTAPKLMIPEGHLKKITLPWKNINPKFRSCDIIASYRKQYKSMISDPFKEYQTTKRDIPEWLVEKIAMLEL